MNDKFVISVSILNSKNVEETIKDIVDLKECLDEKNLKSIYNTMFDIIVHFDIMDGKFVKNAGVDLSFIEKVKKAGMYADTHLMVSNPIEDGYIDNAIKYGSDNITIHYEIEDFAKVIDKLNEIKKEKKDLSIGVSIKPDTDVEVLKKYEGKFSKILIMTVNPGFGGQVYIESINEKIKKAKRLFPNKVIQIDGGVNEDTITEGLNLGVKDFVLGNYLLLSPNKEELYNRVLKLNIIKDIWAHEKDRNVDFDKKLLQIVPNGYGQNDILVGVCVPSIRKLASKWYKHVNFDILDFFISSRYHEYRQFSIFCITNIMNEKLKKNDIDGITQIYRFFEKNINYINNWDLTDEIGPKVLGNYLKIIYKSSYLDARNEVNMYLNNKNMWVKRLGIVSMLTLAKDSITDLPLDVCKEFFYTSEPLLQKATGWVLREIYVKDQKTVIETLSKFNHEKSIPGIILSYACEKMSISEKEYIKKI